MAAVVHRSRPPGSVIRPTTKRRGRRIRRTRSRGSSSTCGSRPAARVADLAAGTGKLTRLLAPAGAEIVAVEPVAGHARDVPPVLPDASRSSRGRPKRCRSRDGVARRDHRSRRRGTGSTTTARPPKRAACPAPGRAPRAGVERARPQRAVGRRGVVDHGPGREARAVARPRELARQRVRERMPGFGELHDGRVPPPPDRSPPKAWSGGSRRSATSPCCPRAERAAVLDEVRDAARRRTPRSRGRTTLEIPYRVDCLAVAESDAIRLMGRSSTRR